MKLKFQSYNKINDVIKRRFSRNMLSVTDMSKHDSIAKTYVICCNEEKRDSPEGYHSVFKGIPNRVHKVIFPIANIYSPTDLLLLLLLYYIIFCFVRTIT